MHKLLAGAALSAAVIGGAAAVVVVNPLGIADAQSTATTAPADPAAPAAGHRPGQVLDEVLNGLVVDGTLDQAQADAVRDGVKAKVGDGAKGGPHGRGPGMREGLDAAASALGMTADELRTELQGGKTIAQVAEEKGVSLDTVKGALVVEATSRLDQAVADGKLTQEQADSAKANLSERIDAMLNATKPAGGPSRGHGPGHPSGDRGAPSTTVPEGQN